MKDIVTPHLGGSNEFFQIPKDPKLTLLDNFKAELLRHRAYYDRYRTPDRLKSLLAKLEVVEIPNWQVQLQPLVAGWTCDEKLVAISGKNGYLLSQILVENLLPAFFKKENVEVYKVLPEWGDWPWGDQMSDEFLFETKKGIWVMHFGVST